MAADLNRGASFSPAAESGARARANLIGGKHVPAAAGDTIEDLNPATGRVHATIPRSGAADVEAAVAAARAAFPAWSATSVEQRADLLDRIADALEARVDELAALESADAGKPITLARTIDIPRAVRNFRFFAGAARHDETGFHPMADAINYTLRKPLGVVGLITPWNLPLYLLSWKVAPALAMGNTIVAKPSELTPLTADALGRIAMEAGLPAGVLNIVHGYGHEVGQALVEHPEVKAISFTGGTATGRRVAATAAPMFKKLSLELGGKNATIVFDDADLDEAVPGAVRAGFTNTGQVCLCGSRLLIHEDIWADFVPRFTEQVKALKVGDTAHPDTQVGAAISQAHRDKVESYLRIARDEGATFHAGGGRPRLGEGLANGAFLEPTVISGVGQDSRCVQEEIFGPVVTLQPFSSDEEAVALANGVPYGLAASIWTRDLKRAHNVSAALDTGMVWVNCWLHRDLRVPFGGMKESGVGREGGRWSLEFFSEARNVCIRLE